MSDLVEALTSPLRIAVSHLAVGSCVTERPHYAGAATRLINAREILTMTINWTRIRPTIGRAVTHEK